MIYNFGLSADPDSNNLNLPPGYKVFNPESSDLEYVQKRARELIAVSGADVQLHCRTENNDFDPVLMEDPDPTYRNGIPFQAYWPPQPLEHELTLWGVDADNPATIVFHRLDVYDKVGERLIRPGDLIAVPFNSLSHSKPRYYQVTNAQEFGNFRYTWLYIKCDAKLLMGDINIYPHADRIPDNPANEWLT